MRELEYQDDVGKKFRVLIPKDCPDSHAKYGIVLGPPDLSSLGFPQDIEVRLNNQLYNRRILTVRDSVSRRSDVLAALQATFAVDVEKIVNLYRGI